MIIEGISKNAEVLTSGVDKSIDMGIDEGSKEILMMILSKSLYSDPVGSIVREWSSNALDATREAGSNEPIIVSLKAGADGYWFKVQDFGVGISPERMEKVISKYAASTKRGDANQLGFFGLGLKSGLAYSDSFNIETVYNGRKYMYVMYEAEEGTKIDLLTEMETTETNGSTFSLKVKYSDHREFFNKINEQLCYFEGIFFDVQGIDNDFKIVTGEDWKFSQMCKSGHLHLCLDNVYYPIDWNKLGIACIGFPVALNFKVSDGLVPTPNREAIKLTPTAKALILSKIEKVATYFCNLYNQQNHELTNIYDYCDRLSKGNTKTVLLESINQVLSVDTIGEYSTVQLQEISLSYCKKLDVRKLILYWGTKVFYNYFTKAEINSRKVRTKDLHYDMLGLLRTGQEVIVSDSPLTKVQKDYLKDLVDPHKEIFVFGKHLVERELGGPFGDRKFSETSYYNILSLAREPKAKWREIIKEFQQVEKQLFERVKAMKEFQPTKEWLEKRKENRAKARVTLVAKQDINPLFCVPSERGYRNWVFKKEGPRLILSFRKKRDFLIYFRESELDSRKLYLEKLQGTIRATEYRKVVPRLAALNERDYKRVIENQKALHNWIKLEDFMEGKHKMFGKCCTCMAITKLKDEYSYLFDNGAFNFIKKLNEKFAEQLKSLQEYNTGQNHSIVGSVDSEIQKDMLNICEEKNLWDWNIYDTYLAVKKMAQKFNFIDLIDVGYGSTIKALELSKEILKARKVRMNPECYDEVQVIEGPGDEEEEEDGPFEPEAEEITF